MAGFSKLRRAAFKRYVDSDISLAKLHEELELDARARGTKAPTLTTLKVWSSKERWPERRAEQDKARRQKELRRIHDKLSVEGPGSLERIADGTKALLDRELRLLLPRANPDNGGMCPRCGRADDTDKGAFKPKVTDAVALMRLQLELHGQLAMAQGVGAGGLTPASEAFPGEDDPQFCAFVAEVADLFARYEGTMPEASVTPDGEVSTGPDLEDRSE